ncbi:MAG: pantoate--beta-alanine ligase [Kiritimatiellae bacterium]|nr:pantoate--beta-alanine ligase [Kiritimatiellia bacterium]
MEVIRDPAQMQQSALAWRAEGRRIAVVPTMGALHDGHRSLIRLARGRADRLVVTLFVNPTQFGPGEDFARYPRNFERDRAICEADGVDVLFAPDVAAMYAPDHSVWVEETALSRGLCGARRPGHFRGVGTVVVKLFMLTQPHVAVFGEKDAQQLRVVRRIVRDLNLPVEIVAAPTVREPDGLAMSSRNEYLTPDERRQAIALRRALEEAAGRVAAGERDPAVLRAAMDATIRRLAPSAEPDYIEIVDSETLEPVAWVDRPVLAAIAVRFPSARLIDNDLLRPPAAR